MSTPFTRAYKVGKIIFFITFILLPVEATRLALMVPIGPSLLPFMVCEYICTGNNENTEIIASILVGGGKKEIQDLADKWNLGLNPIY